MCVCALEYYHDGTNCTNCPSPMKICESDTEALSCIEKYYVEDKLCHPCTYPCEYCIVDKTCSVACPYDFEDRNPLPECTCKVGYYDQKDGNGDYIHDCVICPAPSIECLSEIIFFSCIDTYYNEGSTNTCELCVYPCTNCVSPTYCLTCGFEADKRESP